MNHIPSFIWKNDSVFVLIFSKDQNKWKLENSEKFSLSEENIKKEIKNLEKILDRIDENFEKMEYENPKLSELSLSFDIFQTDNNREKFVNLYFCFENFDESQITIKRKNGEESSYKTNTNTLYSNLEKLYLYLNFKEDQYLRRQVPIDFVHILNELE